MNDDAIKCEHCDGRGWNPPPGVTADQVQAARRMRREDAALRMDERIERLREQGKIPAEPAP